MLEGEEDKLDVGAQIAALAAVRTSASTTSRPSTRPNAARRTATRRLVCPLASDQGVDFEDGAEIIVLHGMDHTAEAMGELGALGYSCALDDESKYTPSHTLGSKSTPEAYLKHLSSVGVAFVPTTQSTCRKLATSRGVESADDEGCLICWKTEVFEATNLTFLALDVRGGNRGAVKVALKRKNDDTPFAIIGAQLRSGDSARDEALRVFELTTPSIGPGGTPDGPSLIHTQLIPRPFCVSTRRILARAAPS